ncbi:MAG: hypothetical protein Q8O88_01460 [bacterium]|nr:hypothetical protein [bacterium]
MGDPTIDGIKARLLNIGNPLTGYHLGSYLGSTLINVNVTGSSAVLHVGNHDKLVFQWTTTGSSAGSILGGNDGINFAVIDQQNFSAAQTILVGVDFATIPKYVKVQVGSNSTGSFTGSITCIIFGR